MKLISIFGIFSIIKIALCGVCPPANQIDPCTCTNVTINCSTEKEFDLGMIFETIAHGKQPNSEDLQFETFILENSNIRRLEDSVFQGVTFDTIKFQNCHQLTCVSPSAFNELEKNLTTFISIETSFNSDEKDCNVFEALKMLYNLETINITKSQISEIPANAFDGKMGALKALKTIDMSNGEGGKITKVGKRAFSTLQNLEYIDLSHHKINKIDSFGFQFMDPIRHKLVIDLTDNNLTENSFGVEAFEVNQRITELRLRGNSKLQVLSETVFQPFLINKINETDDNTIDLSGSPLQCSAGNVWLLELGTPLRLKDKLKNVISTDYQSFWKHSRSECAKAKSTS